MGIENRSFAATVIALVALTAGCSSSSPSATPSVQQPSSSSSPAPVTTTPPGSTSKAFPAPGSDPCLLLTPALAAQALGPTARKSADSGSTASTKRCHYQMGSSMSYAEVGVVVKPKTLAEFTSSFASFRQCSDLAGFGDKALRCDPVRSSTTSADLYYAVHSGSTIVYIGVDLLDAKGNVLPASFDKTRALAVAILG